MNTKVKTEVSAGGIVYKKGKDGIFIAFILDPFNKWTFAKGHVERDETSELGALREVEEEMGFSELEIAEYLGKIDFRFKERGSRLGQGSSDQEIHKFVYYFLMKAPVDAVAKPQKDEKIQEVRWVPLERAEGFSSYKDTDKVLKKAIDILKSNS